MLDSHVSFHARVRPAALAMVTPRREVSYAQLDADVNRYAGAFRELGLMPGTGVVALTCRRPYRHHVMHLALIRLGIAAGTGSDLRCELSLTDRPGPEDGRTIRLSPAWFAEVEASEPVEISSAPRDLDSIGRVLLSSGTTRTPRRVPSTWRQRLDRIAGTTVTDARGRLGVWALVPGIDSGMGYNLAILCWTLGAALAVGFDVRTLPALMSRYPEGLLSVTPIQLQGLLKSLPPGFEVRPEWRVIMTGAALPQALAREALARLTPDIVLSYGTTETGRLALGPASLLETTPGAIGYPAPGVELEIVDPSGAAVPLGEPGEIRARTVQMGKGYLDNAEASGATFRGGWVYPGDVGRRLADGSFVIDGRVDERMTAGGVKLMPNLLENALMEHPQVQDAGAFTVPNAMGLDQCWMAVVADGQVSRESLMAFLRTAGVRLPTVHFARTTVVPRNARGKVDRAALRAQTLEFLSANQIGGEETA